MAWERRLHPELEADLDILLKDLCENWDFCAGVTGAQLLSSGKPLTSKRFTEAVILAEGMVLAEETNWIRRIKRKFVQRYGHEITPRSWQA